MRWQSYVLTNGEFLPHSSHATHAATFPLVPSQLNGLVGSPVDASTRQESDKWLSDFQETDEAWQVADRLLGMTAAPSAGALPLFNTLVLTFFLHVFSPWLPAH